MKLYAPSLEVSLHATLSVWSQELLDVVQRAEKARRCARASLHIHGTSIHEVRGLASHVSAEDAHVIRCARDTHEELEARLFHPTDGALQKVGCGTLYLEDVDVLPHALKGRLRAHLSDASCVLVSTATQSLRHAEDHTGLAYLLCAVELEVPRLGTRPRDVWGHITQMVDELNGSQVRTIAALTEPIKEYLLTYDWPGELDELRQVVWHAYATGDGELWSVEELPAYMTASHKEQEFEGDPERHALVQALAKAKGNRAEAARQLGMSRTTLWRRLNAHGISSD